ncbi:hypothetical protein TI39_contig366g00002 [Zymoseptoria brevis]|uniref:AA1-like domain-containing protein n=1 Tax=Zymoseptoria brevis TaxID=1047168 RepID=A0A0F4GQD3_9PEZI|nr:hypothetical protein TI39_contig366g00002 [Zymoseptoria brevis]
MLSKITATTLLMAAIAIGSPVLPTAKNGTTSAESNTPVMELAEPANSTVKHDSLAGNGTHLVRTFNEYDRIECRFQLGENKFEVVQDSVCVPLEHHKDEDGCPSFYVQPYFGGRDQVVDKYGRQTDDVTCEVKYFYDNDVCWGPSPRSYTQGRNIGFESAMQGFCATGTTQYNISSMTEGVKLRCPKSYAITCKASREAGVEFKEEKDPKTGRIRFVEVKPDLSED